MEEIWKNVPNYDGLYQVSNLGNVKSFVYLKPKILKKSTNSVGYYQVTLCKKTVKKNLQVHQIVAITFLNHINCGYKLVVNHKNHIKKDNRVENLEIITQRENTNRMHLQSSSKYTGVCWSKNKQRWISSIVINKKRKSLGVFKNEIDAHLAYEKFKNENCN